MPDPVLLGPTSRTRRLFLAGPVGVLLSLLLLLVSPSTGQGTSRSHRYYPSTTPQFASQLEIEVVSLIFRNNNILASDTRHNIIFMNVSGIKQTVPQINGPGEAWQDLSSGQAVVVAGNTHTAPLPTSVPQPALSVGIDPLSIAETGNLLYIADGSGRVDALNLTHHTRDLILIPPANLRMNAGNHISKLLKRSPTLGKLLGMATTLPIDPGYIAAIAGGGSLSPGSRPIDALKARISPIVISADGDDLYLAGETGHIYYLNIGSVPRTVPIREGKSITRVSVRPGQILLIAGRGGDSDPHPDNDAIPAFSSTINPTTMIATKRRLFVGDQSGVILEINLSDEPVALPKSSIGDRPDALEPGMVTRIWGGGTHLVRSTPLPALGVMLRPRSMAWDPEGLLFVGDIEETLEAGRILALNVKDKPILLPIMKNGTFRKVSLKPGEMIAIAGNSRRQPIARTTPTAAGDIGIEPVQLSYRNGLLVAGDLLGSVDIMNLTFRNRRVYPWDVHQSLLLPPGTVVSLMGNGTGTSEKPSDEVP